MQFDISKAISLVIQKLEQWLEHFIRMLPNLTVALVVLVAFYFLARIIKGFSEKLFDRFSDRQVISDLFSTIIYFLVLLVGLVISLNILQLEQTVSSILAGAGIIGLALGFAFQDISANLISGVLIIFRKPFKQGDIIATNDYNGIVQTINLRSTVLRTFQGLHVIIPNKEVFQNAIINYTLTDNRRIDLQLGVSYGDDLDKVKDITIQALKELPHLLEDMGVNVYFDEYGDSSINLTAMFWITFTSQQQYLESKSQAIMNIKKAYDQNDITIPFPIRTLDFGIKGGEKLNELPLNVYSSNSRGSN